LLLLLLCWCCLISAVTVATNKVDALIVGYPCVDMSGLNNNPRAWGDESGKTGGGYASLIKYVDKVLPSFVMLENGKELFHKLKRNKFVRPIDLQDEHFIEMGYIAVSLLLDVACFGLPQHRDRSYSMYMLRQECIKSEAMLKQDFLSFMCMPVPVAMTLDNNYVTTKAAAKRKRSTSTSNNGDGAMWRTKLDQFCKDNGKARPVTVLLH
jgi:site-specific DNA-cytosine methylase